MAEDHLLMEEREEFVAPPTNSHSVILRTAHFLKPSVTSIDGVAAPPPLVFQTTAVNYKDLPFKAIFRGWKHPQKDWKTWVDRMSSLHHSTWKRAGILDAVANSTFIIHRNDDLIFSFAERWCPETNSFVFPWGEATITLEDVMEIGRYSVLGKPVRNPTRNREMEETVKKLLRAKSELNKSKAKKAHQSGWMCKFKNSGSEIEQEAFLAYWLSRFVFPIFSGDTIGTVVFPIAVNLAKGKKIALGPAVLACIYQSMGLLKEGLTAARKSGRGSSILEVMVSAPLALVQVWIWERFEKLRPKPKLIQQDGLRLARWDNLKKMDVVAKDIVKVIDSCSAGNFRWCLDNAGGVFREKIHKDDGYWVLVESDLEDEGIEGFVRCLRTSELVGLEEGCIEQYLPHRVAMQFGYDQDIPGHVERVYNVDCDFAWSNYSRPIRDRVLYVPSRVSEPGITTRYLKWWKGLTFDWSGSIEDSVGGTSGSKETDGLEQESEDNGCIPLSPGFSPKKKKRFEIEDSQNLELFQKETREETSGREFESENLQPFQEGTATKFSAQVVPRQIMRSTASETKNEDKVEGSQENGFNSLERKWTERSYRKLPCSRDSVSPPPGFPPKRKFESANLEPFQEGTDTKFSAQAVAPRPIMRPLASKTEAKIDRSQQNGFNSSERKLTERSSRKLPCLTDRVSPPPGFAPKHSLEHVQSQEDTPQGKNLHHSSSRRETRNMDEQVKFSIKAAEFGVKNKQAEQGSELKDGPDGGEGNATAHVDAESAIRATAGMDELEKRVARLHKLCDLLKSGKLDSTLMEKSNLSIGNKVKRSIR